MRSLTQRADAGQEALDISLASVPSAGTFAVLAQAVLKHLLFMRQQIPAPFHILEEVQSV